MARPIARPSRNIRPPQIKIEEVELIGTDNFDSGWVGDLSETRIPNNAFSNIQNFISIRGRWIVQNNSKVYSLGNANNNKVLAIDSFYDKETGLNVLRYDREQIFKAQSNGWVEFTPNPGGIALSGGDQDYFNFAQGDNRFFFSNWGIDPIREIDPVNHEYLALGDAPRARFITTGFNRVVGANIREAIVNPIRVQWSGDLNYSVWDPLTDISAGFQDLVSSPSDTSDDITGIYTISTFLIVTRQRSIFIGQNQPSATNPFFFYAALPRLGADTPRAINLTETGLVWFNFQTAGVYHWTPPEGTPEEVSLPIRKTLKTIIENIGPNPLEIYSSYSFDRRTYSLFVNLPGNIATYEFSYNFTTKVWYRSLWLNLSCVSDLDFSNSDITINELSGDIDDLEGSIDELGGLLTKTTRFMGWETGAIYTLVDFAGDFNRESAILITPTIPAFICTKMIEVPIEDTIENYARFEYIPYQTGTVKIDVALDKDIQDIRATKTVTITAGMLDKPQIIFIKRPVHARNLVFRLTATGCVIELTGFYIRGQKSGVSSK